MDLLPEPVPPEPTYRVDAGRQDGQVNIQIVNGSPTINVDAANVPGE
jgi:hypothetical protein